MKGFGECGSRMDGLEETSFVKSIFWRLERNGKEQFTGDNGAEYRR